LLTVGYLGEQRADRVIDLFGVLIVQHAAVTIDLGKYESLDDDLLIAVEDLLPLLEAFLHLVDRLVLASGERPLIEALGGGQRRRVADHDLEKFQGLDVAPEYPQTYRKRGREDQADRSPKPGPECGGDHDRDRR